MTTPSPLHFDMNDYHLHELTDAASNLGNNVFTYLLHHPDVDGVSHMIHQDGNQPDLLPRSSVDVVTVPPGARLHLTDMNGNTVEVPEQHQAYSFPVAALAHPTHVRVYGPSTICVCTLHPSKQRQLIMTQEHMIYEGLSIRDGHMIHRRR